MGVGARAVLFEEVQVTWEAEWEGEKEREHEWGITNCAGTRYDLFSEFNLITTNSRDILCVYLNACLESNPNQHNTAQHAFQIAVHISN